MGQPTQQCCGFFVALGAWLLEMLLPEAVDLHFSDPWSRQQPILLRATDSDAWDMWGLDAVTC